MCTLSGDITVKKQDILCMLQRLKRVQDAMTDLHDGIDTEGGDQPDPVDMADVLDIADNEVSRIHRRFIRYITKVDNALLVRERNRVYPERGILISWHLQPPWLEE